MRCLQKYVAYNSTWLTLPQDFQILEVVSMEGSRDHFIVVLGNPSGPLVNVQFIGVEDYAHVEDDFIFINSVETNEDYGRKYYFYRLG